jgi:hypothetical protein
MSDRSRGDGWWQAADGKWYPPELLDAPRQQWPTTELTPVVRAAAETAVPPGTGAQVVVAVASILFFGVGAAGLVFASAIREADDGWFSDLTNELAGETMWASLSAFSILALIVAAVFVIVWAFKASKAMTARGPEGRTWAPGWAIGGWFVPLANLVIPRLVFGELEKMAAEPYRGAPLEKRWKGHRRFSTGDLWWFLWVAGNVISYLGTFASNPAVDAPGRYATFLTVGSMGGFVVAISGVVLILEIRAIVAASSQ